MTGEYFCPNPAAYRASLLTFVFALSSIIPDADKYSDCMGFDNPCNKLYCPRYNHLNTS